jgi:hypothetical protein
MTRYETPAFDPGIAFSWTLRSEEIARRRRQRPRDLQADRKTFESKRRDEAQVSEQPAGYETPAFAPGVAFSWTRRSAEIARRQSRQQFGSKPNLTQLNGLLAA